MNPRLSVLSFGLLGLSLLVPAARASQEVAPGQMDMAVFQVIRAEAEQARDASLKDVPPSLPDPGPGVPSEDRAIARIRAMAPVLRDTTHPQAQRVETIQMIAEQGTAGMMAREEAIQAIGQCLTNSSHHESIQLRALGAFGRIGAGSRRAMAALAVVLQRLDNPVPVRRECIRVIRGITTSEVYGDALNALSGVVRNASHHETIQCDTVDCIAYLGRDDVNAVQLLSTTLRDTSRPLAMRRRVVSALLQVRDERAREAGVAGLAQVLINADHHETLQLAAVEALAYIGRFSINAIATFGRVLSHTGNPIAVRLSILRVIEAGPGANAPESLDAVSSVFRSAGHHVNVQLAAVRACAAIGRNAPPLAVRNLGMVLRDTSFDMQTRMAAIRAISDLGRGNREAEEILEAVTRNTSHHENVRRAAQAALTELYRS